jgi:hypothetical protein
MPNLVDSWIRFTGTEKALQTLLEKPFDFESWFPVPPNMTEADNYKWKKQNWGATWISEDYARNNPTPVRLHQQTDGAFECTFITPWSPPLRFLWKLQESITDLQVEYEYCDYMSGYCGFGTGPLEEQNKYMEYMSKEDLNYIHSLRKWHVSVFNPHLVEDKDENNNI